MKFRVYAPVTIAFLFCLVILSTAPFSAFASIDDDARQKAAQAETYLKKLVDEVLVIVRDPDLIANPPAQEKTLYDKGLEIFDFNTFSMLALGPKYRKFTPQQRTDFQTYFSKLISQTYFPKLAGQDVENISINYLSNRPLKPKKKIFRTDIFTELVRGDTQIPIIYRMISRDDAPWKIYDIKIEGVSMAANYREQYSQQVSLTPEDIITQLKEKVE
ncbi:MAG TPA: hypothetical protein DHV36_09955 [Desulfobacteraceae bacterium]|nr:hypothetical protein [Desulfobacteraceae bacterium]|tara:strand:- start:9 stop:659 length:651 start_codon:yes stop_codon:yes gene_type:complete